MLKLLGRDEDYEDDEDDEDEESSGGTATPLKYFISSCSSEEW